MTKRSIEEVSIEEVHSSDGEQERMEIPPYLDGTIPDRCMEVTFVEHERDDFIEAFSGPRIAPAMRKLCKIAVVLGDLRTMYDFKQTRSRACFLHEVESRRPRTMMTSAPCTWFSSLMHMWNKKKMCPVKRAKMETEARHTMNVE